jgi:M6 family metalloprotease-like protein
LRHTLCEESLDAEDALMDAVRRWLPVLALLAVFAPRTSHAQSREISGRLDVAWGMRPNLEGAPAFRYSVFDEATRKNIEVRFTDLAVDRLGGAQSLNGKRVRLAVADENTPFGLVTRVTDVRSVAADLNGRRVPDLARRLEDAPAPHHGANLVSGSRKYLTILCKFSNKANEPGTKADYEAFFLGPSMSVAHYWGEVSEQRVNFNGSVVTNWLTMAHDSAYYFPNGAKDADLGRLATDCTAAADPSVNFTDFDGIIAQFNGSLGCCGWGGGWTLSLDGQTKSYGFVWLPPHGTPPTGLGFQSHEVGHSLGLPHSGGPYGRTYDSKWDVMSSASAYFDAATSKSYGATTIAYHKLLLEWIPQSRTFVATNPVSTVRVERLALPGPNDFQVAVVPIRGTPNYYTIESRRKAGYDNLLALEGVVIHHVQPTGRAEPAWVVDADGNGNPNDAGATWVPGETFVDVRNQISITVDSLLGTVYKVTIRSGGTTSLALGRTGKKTTVNPNAAAVFDTLPVTVAGSGPSAWSALKKNGRGSWLEMLGPVGNGSGAVVLKRVPTGLGVGTYVDTVLVTLSPQPGAPPPTPMQYLDTLVVQDAGATFLGLSVRSRTDSGLFFSGFTDSALVRITGPNNGTTAWTATKKRGSTTLVTASGTGPGTVRWSRSAFNQAVGLIVDTITVTATGNPALTAMIVDTFRVLENVVLTRTPRTQRNAMPEGAPAQVDSTIITLSGRWATSGKLESFNYYWLRTGKFLRPGRTGDPNFYYEARTGNSTLSWTRAPRDLAPGTYIDTLTICGPYCWYQNAQLVGHAGYQYIVDTLTVSSAPLAMVAQAPSRRDTTALALNISKDSVRILLTGAGAGAVKWTAASQSGKSILISDGAFNAPGTGIGSGWLVWTRDLVGRAPGTYTDNIVVSAPGVTSVTVYDTLVVMQSAALTVGRASGRRGIVTGAAAVEDSVDVQLLGSAASGVSWTASKKAAFTTFSVANGTGPGKMRFTRNTTGFTPGQVYVDTLTVSAPNAYGGTAIIIDSLEALSGSAIALSKRTRIDSAGMAVAGTLRDSVAVTLSGVNGPSTNWTSTKKSAWVSIVNGTGTGSGYLIWTRNPNGLSVGNYVDTLVVTATGAVASPITVIDTLRIVPSAVIAVSSVARADSAMVGSATVRSDSVTLTLSGTLGASAAWTATKKRASTTLITANGTGTGKVRWERSASGLGAGIYVDTITVTAAANGATPRVVIDTFRIIAATAVQIAAATHNVASLQGGNKAKGDSASATVTGFASNSSQWTATKSATWLTLTTSTGTTGQRVRWTRNQTGLAAGTYVDTIRLSVAGSPAPAALIVDTLRVITIVGLDAAKHLLGTSTLDATRTTILDHEGNADGAFNLGDVLAHLNRTGAVLTNSVMAELIALKAAPPRDSTTSAGPGRRQ